MSGCPISLDCRAASSASDVARPGSATCPIWRASLAAKCRMGGPLSWCSRLSMSSRARVSSCLTRSRVISHSLASSASVRRRPSAGNTRPSKIARSRGGSARRCAHAVSSGSLTFATSASSSSRSRSNASCAGLESSPALRISSASRRVRAPASHAIVDTPRMSERSASARAWRASASRSIRSSFSWGIDCSSDEDSLAGSTGTARRPGVSPSCAQLTRVIRMISMNVLAPKFGMVEITSGVADASSGHVARP